MKKILLSLIAAGLMLTSCTTQQYAGGATGAGLGGMFGSSIGGILGGPRGSDVTTTRTTQRTTHSSAYAGIDDYSSYGSYSRATSTNWSGLEVTSVQFVDANGDRCLGSGEHASVVMDIYNRSGATLYNIAPHITCDNKRINLSPTAIVSRLDDGQGFRYTLEVVAGNMKDGVATFSVAFGNERNAPVVKTFRLRTLSTRAYQR
jgi:hypothetical protein